MTQRETNLSGQEGAMRQSGRFDCPVCGAGLERRQLQPHTPRKAAFWQSVLTDRQACPHCKTTLRSRYRSSRVYAGVFLGWALAKLALVFWLPEHALRPWLMVALSMAFIGFVLVWFWRERNDRGAYERDPRAA